MGYSTLILEREGAIATITLDRPEKRNAISTEMLSDLLAALDEVEASPARVTIIRGSGKAFCAGMDLEGLRSLLGQSPQESLRHSRQVAAMFLRIYGFPKPVIAAVNGAAIAGGCAIATLADFTLAVPGAKFGYTEVKIGFAPALVSVFLRRQIGEKQARDLLLSGRIIDAAEAFRMGLVNEIIPAERLMARARELASELAAASPASVTRTKRLLLACDQADLKSEIELAIRENAEIRSTPDFREGLTSFLEKRPPKWTGE
ncbi:MAG TPA: enoyl-CoA hydratase-related protein [Candidatus Polarisedimenticolia bacterium]|nr:enoyl-CoA hydratase-related protein [Candidatus Polarisedimenticolia bacterium]